MYDDEEIESIPIERALNNPRLLMGLPEKAIFFWGGLPVVPMVVSMRFIGPWAFLIPVAAILICHAITAIWPDFWRQSYLAMTYFGDVRESRDMRGTIVFEP